MAWLSSGGSPRARLTRLVSQMSTSSDVFGGCSAAADARTQPLARITGSVGRSQQSLLAATEPATQAARAAASGGGGGGGRLSPEDAEHFAEHGYCVVRGAVPKRLCDAVVADIWEVVELRPDDPPASWYRRRPARSTRSGARHPLELDAGRAQQDLEVSMLNLWQTDACWATRQHPAVHAAFAALLGTERLWVDPDCCNMKPPVSAANPGWGGSTYLHWDAGMDDLRRRPRDKLQGVLYLSEVGADGGGFRCIPGFHRRLEEPAFRAAVLARRAAAADNAAGGAKDLGGWLGGVGGGSGSMPVVTVAGGPGDLVIWSSLLPHGNAQNTSDQPRLAQYITMRPVPPTVDEAERQTRVANWEGRISGGRGGGREKAHPEATQPAKLTPLGRRLLGADPW
eukprot:SAG11_NODE_3151_length_2646_cov_4.100903_2_plen_398_part_00